MAAAEFERLARHVHRFAETDRECALRCRLRSHPHGRWPQWAGLAR